jgi:beta-N-acetylhexosaminidase
VIPLKLKFFALAVVAALAPAPAFAQSLEQMAGQMIIVGFAGNSAKDKSVVAVRDQIAQGKIGGVMYLKTNVASLAAVKAMNAVFRAASPDLPPFLTLDQEGGAVERLTADVGFKELPNAQTIAASNSPQAAGKIYADMATSIAKLGFTVNFGPVIDLNVNPSNPIIGKYGRSFGKGADTVEAYAGAFIKAHRQAGVLTSLKHFPGHGSSTTDSHEGFVDISRTWKDSELDPYRVLVKQGLADFVMVGHLYDSNHDKAGARLPASLSPEWIGGVLRKDIGYDGPVISDDLEMGAIRKRFSLKETVVKAVNAGVDVLLFSNTAAYSAGLGEQIRGILVAEAKADPKFAARIQESYKRIVKLKGKIGPEQP